MQREWRADVTCQEISTQFEKKVDGRMVPDVVEWKKLPAKMPLWGGGDQS